MIDGRRLRPDQLAALYAQFAAGLPARALVMRDAVEALGAGPAPDAAKRLYTAAHALRGTAQVYGAVELVPHAERLERWAEAWRHDGRADPATLEDVRRELDLLAAAIAAAAARRPAP